MKAAILALLILSQARASAQNCGDYVGGTSAVGESHISYLGSLSKASSGLIAYLEVLLDANEMTIADLRGLRDSLLEGKIQNPLSTGGSLTNRIHGRVIDEYLQTGQVEPKLVAEWALDYLTRWEKGADVRKAAQAATVVNEVKMKFHRIEPGPAGEFTLDHPIEVMETLVTQRMYVEPMHANPSLYPRDENLPFVADRPVESVTWFEAAQFANKVSEQNHLKPAYVFHKGSKRFKNSMRIVEEMDQVGVNAPDGDIYRAEGYRLPTVAEFQYLALRDSKAFANNLRDIDDYIWHAENSGGEPHPVTGKLPFIIDGSEFFDLLGNVPIWAHDIPGASPKIALGGLNPLLRTRTRTEVGVRVSLGFTNLVNRHRQTHWTSTFLDDRECNIGIRLVRTVK